MHRMVLPPCRTIEACAQVVTQRGSRERAVAETCQGRHVCRGHGHGAATRVAAGAAARLRHDVTRHVVVPLVFKRRKCIGSIVSTRIPLSYGIGGPRTGEKLHTACAC